MNRLAIVTTLRNAADTLESFVAYHRTIGFERLYLFFDDPNDPTLPAARQLSGVIAIPYDSALRAQWEKVSQYEAHCQYLDSEVQSRQLLNVQVAMSMARDEGYDWLLGIDVDELFWPAFEGVHQQFAGLGQAGADAVLFMNAEAIPEQEVVVDFFKEVDLFKLPWNTRPPALEEKLSSAQGRFPQLRPYFHFYDNGKSAVRLAAKGVEPVSVHGFRRPGEPREATKEATSKSLFILHYPCCGFEHFWMKYRTLGKFADTWWGKKDIAEAIGTFHLEARDVVMTGDRDLARAFYRERLAVMDHDQARELVDLGLAIRVDQPKRVLLQASAR